MTQPAFGLQRTWLWSQLCINNPQSPSHLTGTDTGDGVGTGEEGTSQAQEGKKAQRTFNGH